VRAGRAAACVRADGAQVVITTYHMLNAECTVPEDVNVSGEAAWVHAHGYSPRPAAQHRRRGNVRLCWVRIAGGRHVRAGRDPERECREARDEEQAHSRARERHVRAEGAGAVGHGVSCPRFVLLLVCGRPVYVEYQYHIVLFIICVLRMDYGGYRKRFGDDLQPTRSPV
jgi:hypothetical protein